jgi:hypothetical protein
VSFFYLWNFFLISFLNDRVNADHPVAFFDSDVVQVVVMCDTWEDATILVLREPARGGSVDLVGFT